MDSTSICRSAIASPRTTRPTAPGARRSRCKAGADPRRGCSPRIVISLDGLTLHLVDAATGYDKVFPVGVGAINHHRRRDQLSASRCRLYPVAGHRAARVRHHAVVDPAVQVLVDRSGDGRQVSRCSPACRSSRWYGNYAIHGPIDNFRAPNGGNLRRGYVSHGCIRLEAADILEVYARIQWAGRVPVHVQKEPERASDGRRVDVPTPWIGAECLHDGDCNLPGARCHPNAATGRGFCTRRLHQLLRRSRRLRADLLRRRSGRRVARRMRGEADRAGRGVPAVRRPADADAAPVRSAVGQRERLRAARVISANMPSAANSA